MSDHSRLENYLESLDRALRALPVGDRAEIVTEIKSHILSAMERDPGSGLQSALNALGAPETVANKYLMERGVKPVRPSISPIVKWLIIGFVSTVGLVVALILFLVFYFTPLIKVDGPKGQISLLGGMIEVSDESMSELDLGFIETAFGRKKYKRQWMVGGSASGAYLYFSMGKVDVETASSDDYVWECRSSDPALEKVELRHEDSRQGLDLRDLKGVKCRVLVPIGGDMVVSGEKGKIDVDRPDFHVKVDLQQGKVDFRPHPERDYQYDVEVQTGVKDRFESSANPSALRIAIKLDMGKVSRE